MEMKRKVIKIDVGNMTLKEVEILMARMNRNFVNLKTASQWNRFINVVADAASYGLFHA